MCAQGVDWAVERRENDIERYHNRRRRLKGRSWVERAIEGTYGSYAKGRRNISHQFLEQLQAETPNCKCCGIELDYSYVDKGSRKGERLTRGATLDKLIPSLGYIEGNVAIICFSCNRRKSDMTISDLQRIIDYILEATSDVGRLSAIA